MWPGRCAQRKPGCKVKSPRSAEATARVQDGGRNKDSVRFAGRSLGKGRGLHFALYKTPAVLGGQAGEEQEWTVPDFRAARPGGPFRPEDFVSRFREMFVHRPFVSSLLISVLLFLNLLALASVRPLFYLIFFFFVFILRNLF